MRSISHWGLFECEHWKHVVDKVKVTWGDTLITKYTCQACGTEWASGELLVQREVNALPDGITWVDA